MSGETEHRSVADRLDQAGRLTHGGGRELVEPARDASELIGRKPLSEPRVVHQVGKRDGDLSGAGQATGSALGLGDQLAAYAVTEVGAEVEVHELARERSELVGRSGVAQPDRVLRVAGLEQGLAGEAPHRVRRVRHALAEDAAHLEQARTR